MIARPLGQPALDGEGLVGSGVVQDQVHFEVRGYGRVESVEEAPELPGPVPTVAGADDLPILHVEGELPKTGSFGFDLMPARRLNCYVSYSPRT